MCSTDLGVAYRMLEYGCMRMLEYVVHYFEIGWLDRMLARICCTPLRRRRRRRNWRMRRRKESLVLHYTDLISVAVAVVSGTGGLEG